MKIAVKISILESKHRPESVIHEVINNICIVFTMLKSVMQGRTFAMYCVTNSPVLNLCGCETFSEVNGIRTQDYYDSKRQRFARN